MKTNQIKTVGIDLAKNVFQIHAADAKGNSVMRRKLSRSKMMPFFAQLPPCLIGMEACGGAHHWARQLQGLGHEVKLIAPQFVKPYVKTNKSDAVDAEAIAEAVTRPRMRFVAIKKPWQQEILAVHRIRERLVKERTALMNSTRGLLYEHGIIFARGKYHLQEGLAELLSESGERLSERMQHLMQMQYTELVEMDRRLAKYEAMIKQTFRSHESCRQLGKLPGIGPITATAMVATLGDPSCFHNGRHVSAFLGLVPRHEGSGGKTRLLGISKRGDRYVRKLLVHGARSVLRVAQSKRFPNRQDRWVVDISQRRGFNKACVALANKNARRCWAVLAGRHDPLDATGSPPHHVDKGICSASPSPQDAVDIPRSAVSSSICVGDLSE